MSLSMSQPRPGLFRFDDTCNVYLLVREGRSIAIDFGSGAWLEKAAAMGLPIPEAVYLTHHHADCVAGLASRNQWPFAIHAPIEERAYLDPDTVASFWRARRAGGNPSSYAVLPRGLMAPVKYDMMGFADLFWGSARLRFLHTPGHGPHALSILVDLGREQVVFCGDAAHAGATIHQPYHLEWDHWTGSGALAAWQGIERLRALRIDLLCPAHGPDPTQKPAALLATLAKRLMALYHAKGSICPDEPDGYLTPELLEGGAAKVLPGLYAVGMNTWVLLSQKHEAMIFDPQIVDIDVTERLLESLGRPKVTAVTATHFHQDHSDGLPHFRARHGAKIVLHPRVAAPLGPQAAIDAPWLPAMPIVADVTLPAEGTWRWKEFEFRVAPFPGQTWWHAAFMTTIGDKRVFFGGDNFQPNSRWNGTGGFSAFNGSRFREGFEASAALVLDWKPQVLVNGHNTYFAFRPSHFRKIVRWSRQAERAVAALCPSGDLERDYYLHCPGADA